MNRTGAGSIVPPTKPKEPNPCRVFTCFPAEGSEEARVYNPMGRLIAKARDVDTGDAIADALNTSAIIEETVGDWSVAEVSQLIHLADTLLQHAGCDRIGGLDALELLTRAIEIADQGGDPVEALEEWTPGAKPQAAAATGAAGAKRNQADLWN